MKDLMYFCDSSITLVELAYLFPSKDYYVSAEEDEIYIASKDEDWLFFKIQIYPEIINSYEQEELDYVYSKLPSFQVLTCNYRDVGFAKLIVGSLAQKYPGIVDNDFDELMTSEKFLERAQKDAMWDWTLP